MPGYVIYLEEYITWNVGAEKGVIWRLGDGENMDIWRDPWLPRDLSRRPVTPRGRTLATQVSELINHVTGGWDVELMHDVFL